MRPRLLDLFSGAGGAARGYQLAGFHVTGVDIKPQPRYAGDEFHQGDAMRVLDGSDGWDLTEYDAIHASPPCHDHTSLVTVNGKPNVDGSGWLLTETLTILRELGMPHVVENVPRARMPGAFTLCARSFGVERMRRHRQFVTNWFLLVPPCACRRGQLTLGVYGDLSRSDRSAGADPASGSRRWRAGVTTARELLGCPWMEAAELSQAIPPAYTQFIGEQLLTHLRTAVTR